MSTVEELRQLLKDIADATHPDAANMIRQRIGDIERDAVAQSHQPRR